MDRATPHCSKITKKFLDENKDITRLEYFPVGSPEFNAVEECWRQGKYNILWFSERYNFVIIELQDSNLDIVKYLMRSTN